MTKILQCSDAHADYRTAGVDRYDDVAEAFAQTVRAAVDEKVSLYLFTGDLADPDDGPRALRAAGLAVAVAMDLAEHGIPSWWLQGNHDAIEDSSGRSVLSPLRGLASRGVLVFERPACVLLPGAPGRSALMLPYPPASSPYDPAAYVRSLRKECSQPIVMVAGHLTEIPGVPEGEESLEMARGRGVPFPLAECCPRWLLVNGHWHEGQTVRRGEHTIHIPGSMVRLNHGEEKSRPRFFLWDL